MITRFVRPASVPEALRAQRETADAVFIAGGTHLLSPAMRDRPMAAVSIEGLLPREIRASAELLSIGALATLQDLVESGGPRGTGGPAVATGGSVAEVELALLRGAAASMGSRNLRNRATVGGNVAANKPSACLAPALLALDARLLLADGSRQAVADYLAAPGGLIEAVEVPLVRGRGAAYRRWARTESDITGVAIAVALLLSGGTVAGVRIAAVPGAARLVAVEALFEGRELPPRAEIERAVLPLLDAASDIRASAPYRRLRAAQLIADALLDAKGAAARVPGPDGRKENAR